MLSMKKIMFLAVACCVVAAAVVSCNKKAAATPGATAKRYVQHIVDDDYASFVKAIAFIEPVPAATQKAAHQAHATAMRTIHKPDVDRRGGVREIRVVSEKMHPDKKTCDVVLSSHYNDGSTKTVNMQMVNDRNMWKIRETPYKEIWHATTSDGDNEVLKVRTGHERDFVKDKAHDLGEKQFVKDLSHRNGDVEVIKTLENGHRHREVIKNLQEGNRTIDKVGFDGEREVGKDIDRVKREVLKEKEKVDGERGRARDAIKK